jgi:hypothetical protein
MSDEIKVKHVLHAALGLASTAFGGLPQNGDLWTYTIRGGDGSPYLTRTLLPRIAGQRPLLHHIHREDQDRHMHNHPWRTATFQILCGGYVEERLVNGAVVTRTLRPGDQNEIDAGTFHRVTHVEPDTWTFGIVGERCQEWGFLVDGAVVPSAVYFARKGHVDVAGAGQS